MIRLSILHGIVNVDFISVCYPCPFHSLRHGIASYLYAEGISFEDIGKYLGHKFHNVTMDVYIDLTKEKQKMILEKIDKWIADLTAD